VPFVALAERLKPDLTIVGPEGPLVAGIRDKFECRRMRLVGHLAAGCAARGEQDFSPRNSWAGYRIPTATLYGTFDSPGEGDSGARRSGLGPVVVKSERPCAVGKGVLVAETREEEAAAFIRRPHGKNTKLGQGGSRVLLRDPRSRERSFPSSC